MVEQHVGYLGVVVSDSQRYLSGLYQPVEIQHLRPAGLHLVYEFTHRLSPVLRIPGQGRVPLSVTEPDVVESGQCVHQRLVKIREHGLEPAYAAAAALSQQRRVRFIVTY